MKELASLLLTVMLSLLLGVCLGYGLAMSRMTLSEEVHSVRGEPVTASLALPVARTELLPDSLRGGLRLADIDIPAGIVFPDSADLRPTVYDWNLERKYEEQLFDSESGEMNVRATVQYNRLQDLSTTFIPVNREVIRYVTPTWRPYVMMQYHTLHGAAVGGGIFYRKTGYYIMYNTDFRRNGFGVGMIYSFR
ncbi:MAG: hypothetical protein LBB90_03740 [Tannerella sp.]|jgi:hypothetical protein|nr:hypothetical protein [Tannerella sp.]